MRRLSERNIDVRVDDGIGLADRSRDHAHARRAETRDGLLERRAYIALEHRGEVVAECAQGDVARRERFDRPELAAGENRPKRCRVGHRSCNRPDVIERGAERDDTLRRNFAERGFEPHNAACRGGNSDRAAGVRPDRREPHSHRDRRRRAAARSAGRAGEVARVVHRAECRFLARGAQRELMEVCLSDQNGTRLAEPFHHHGISLRDMTRPNLGRGRCRLAGDIYEIFDRDRHSVQRTSIDASPPFLVDGVCGGACAGFIDENERVGPCAMFGDGGKALLDQCRGRNRRCHVCKATVAWARRQACGDVA